MPALTIADLNNGKTDIDTIAAVATSTALAVLDRLGHTRTTLAGAMSVVDQYADSAEVQIAGYVAAAIAAMAANIGTASPSNNRGTWAASTAYSATSFDVVQVSGTWYRCLVSHTSGSSFSTDLAAGKWTLLQGVTTADLATSGGASLLGYGASRVANILDATYVDLGKQDPSAYGGTVDAAPALNALLATTDKVFIAFNILLKSQVNGNGKQILIAPTANVYGDMSMLTGAKTSSTGSIFLFSGATGGSIRGGSIRPKTYTDNRDCVGVRVVSSSGVTIEGVEFSQFSKANGIVDITTCNQCEVLKCKFHDCTTNSGTNGQITGVCVDDNKVGGIPSYGIKILGNTFKNLTVGSSFKAAFGVQTDGVNIQTLAIGSICSGNYFENVGEGIDNWGDYGNFNGNTAVDCKIFAYKLIHGASYNTLDGNIAYRSGLAAFCLSGSSTATKDTLGNTITGGNLGQVDPDGDWAANGTAAIIVYGAGLTYQPRNNTFSNVGANPGSTGKYALYSDSNGSGNVYNLRILGSGSVQRYAKSDASTEFPLVRDALSTALRVSKSSDQSVAANTDTQVNFNVRTLDRRGEWNISAFKFHIEITGLYSIKAALRFAAFGPNKSVTMWLARTRSGSTVTVSLDSDSSTGMDQTFELSDLIALNEGDDLAIYVRHNDTVSRSFDHDYSYATILAV